MGSGKGFICAGMGEGGEQYQDTRSWAVHLGIAHWEIGMDGAAVSLEDNRGINIKE